HVTGVQTCALPISAFDSLPSGLRISEEVREVTHWTAQQLKRSQRDFLAQLPEQIALHVEGLGDVLFCHATPRSDEEIFTPITPQERLNTIFAGIEQQIVVCGHTHMQFERREAAWASSMQAVWGCLMLTVLARTGCCWGLKEA